MRAQGVGVMAGAVLLSAIVAAQDRPSFSIQSELVMLHASVKDSRGRFVAGLKPEAFSIFDNNRPQTVQLFLDEDSPVTVGLVVDSSGSMAANRDLVVQAARSFANSSNPYDELFAIAFADAPRPALPADTPFTNDASYLSERLGNAIASQGRTAFWDALDASLDYVAKGSQPRKILIIVGDGADNASRTTTLERITSRLQTSNVVVYGVAIVDRLDDDAKPGRLRELAQATGGEMFRPESPKRVVEALREIARDIRHQYVLAYAPAAAAPGEGPRRIRVGAVDRDGRRLTVHTRTGYQPRSAP